jgi:hypothetical protein
MSRFCAAALVGGSFSRVLVSWRRTWPCPGASGCASVASAYSAAIAERATSNLVFGIRAEKGGGGGCQRVCDYACTVPARIETEKVFYPCVF